MSEIKLLEVRDRGTLMPVMAIRPMGTNDAEHWLWNRSGYGGNTETQQTYVIIVDMSEPPGVINYDPYSWDNRTLRTAHRHIAEHWNELASGAVIDVEFILGESQQPKISERLNQRRPRHA